MTRGLGVVDALQGLLPEEATVLLSAMTQLGDVWFVLVLVTLVYWFRDRRDGAFAIGSVLGGLALVIAAKAAFGLPRPPEAVRLVAADGYGFPSGHAMTVTVAWGTLALVLDDWTRRRRAAVAGAVIALVAFTRVALGVHFVVDVVAGVAVGAGYLAALVLWTDGEPRRALLVAVGLSAVAVAMTAASTDALMLLGASVGAGAAYRVGQDPGRSWRRSDAGLVFGVAVVGVGLLIAAAGDLRAAVFPVLALLGGLAVVGLPPFSERYSGTSSSN